MLAGFLLASGSAIGSSLCEIGRKHLVRSGMDAPTIVSVVCTLQGVFGVLALTAAAGGLPVRR